LDILHDTIRHITESQIDDNSSLVAAVVGLCETWNCWNHAWTAVCVDLKFWCIVSYFNNSCDTRTLCSK